MREISEAGAIALDEARKVANKATAHASTARSIYNKNKADIDAVDAAQTLAQVSIAESLSGLFQLLLFAIEEDL